MQLVAHEAHSLIEEFMILANSIIANFLCEKYEFVPLRVQKTPDVGLLVDWFEKHQSLNRHVQNFTNRMHFVYKNN
jgi:exoribonuclease R